MSTNIISNDGFGNHHVPERPTGSPEFELLLTMHVETVALLSNTPKKKVTYITLDVEMEDYYRIMKEEQERGGKHD